MSDNRRILGDLLNPLDRLVSWLDPDAGLKRLARRAALQAMSRAHEASNPSRLRKFYKESLGPNGIVQQGAGPIRDQVRHITRNNDVARGIVRTMVNNIVGPNGIGIEPQPRRKDGTIHEAYAKDLRNMLRDWSRRPEVQRRFTLAKSERMLAWAWIRDGESFSQDLAGPVPLLNHSTAVPYSFELFEADMVPLAYNDPASGVRQGIERDAWGRARNYYVYKGHPLETATNLLTANSLKTIDAGRVRHIAFLDHIGQSRGISEFASIIARLEDIKDYEESERIAAKVAAMLTAYVKKNAGESGYDPSSLKADTDGKPLPRELAMQPGMIIDGLVPGEEIGVIDSKRPNPNVVTFRQGQLRAAAAGIGASYSSISKSYDGTFSAQRQELVEQWVNYAVLADDFVGMWLQPTYETLVAVADMSGVLRIPKDVLPGTHDDCLFTAQAMPWIDPYKEAQAWVLLARAGLASEVEILRRRGVNPRDLLEQVSQWRAEAKEKNLVFTSDASNASPIAPPKAGVEPGADDLAAEPGAAGGAE